MHPAERACDVLAHWSRFLENTPDELTTVAAFLTAPPAPFVPEGLRGQLVVAIVGCFAGEVSAGERALQPIRRFGPPAVDVFSPMPYPALQPMLDAGAPAGLRAYWKSGYLRSLGEAEIETLVVHASSAPSPLTQIHLHQLGGVLGRVSPDSTSFAHRDARLVLNIVAGWRAPEDDPVNLRWARDFWSAIRPATNGVYVNFLDNDDRRIHEAYDAATLARLKAAKASWDPDNAFRLNHNIEPLVPARSSTLSGEED